MDFDPQFYRLRLARAHHAELLAEVNAQVERHRALRAEITEQRAEGLGVAQQLRAANATLLAKAAELMEASRRLGSVAKAHKYLYRQR